MVNGNVPAGCREGIEGNLCQKHNKIPEKTHNLAKLAKDTGVIEECNEEVQLLLNKLLVYYYGTKYPDKREKLRLECTNEYIGKMLNQTKEVYAWLKNKL